MKNAIEINRENIAAFCKRWQVSEFSVFGSVIRDDFVEDSDVDILVSFEPSVRRTLFDMVHMQQELEEMLGRGVDLVTRRAIESSRNHLRREAILSSAKVVYAS